MNIASNSYSKEYTNLYIFHSIHNPYIFLGYFYHANLPYYLQILIVNSILVGSLSSRLTCGKRCLSITKLSPNPIQKSFSLLGLSVCIYKPPSSSLATQAVIFFFHYYPIISVLYTNLYMLFQ